MSDLVERLRKDAAKLRGDMMHVKSGAVSIEEAADAIEHLRDALTDIAKLSSYASSRDLGEFAVVALKGI